MHLHTTYEHIYELMTKHERIITLSLVTWLTVTPTNIHHIL